MISLAVLDDQYKPVAAEGPGKEYAAVIRRDYGSPGPRLVDQALGRLALLVGFAEAEHQAAGDRHGDEAASLAEWPCQLGRRRQREGQRRCRDRGLVGGGGFDRPWRRRLRERPDRGQETDLLLLARPPLVFQPLDQIFEILGRSGQFLH